MAKKPSRSSAKTRKGKPGTAADPTAPKKFTKVTLTVGPDGKVQIPSIDAIPDKPLPSVRETIDALDKAIPDVVATSKRKKAARAGAHPPIPEAAGGPETAPGSAKLPTGEETTPSVPRPTDYSDELADDLLEHMGNGGSAASWCSEATHWRYATLLRHLAARPEFAKSYARAREAHADAIFDQCLDIADDKSADWIELEGGGRRFNNEAAARSRVRIDARMKIAGRLNPARYAETSNLNLDDKRPATADERLARIQQLLLAGVPKPAPEGGA